MTAPPAAVPTAGLSAGRPLSCQARALRVLHNCIGCGELGCLGYLWFCAITRRRDRWLRVSIAVLAGEGTALVAARGCPLGFFQRRAGDDVPMFEVWLGPRLAPLAIPAFTLVAVAGVVTAAVRPDEGSLALGQPAEAPGVSYAQGRKSSGGTGK